MTSETPAAILAVCTGNLCRSPVVERLFRVGVTTRWPSATSALPVASAGTAAALGQRMPDAFAARLRSIGAGTAPHAPFTPRQVTSEMLDGAELVITATRAHRAAVVELHPRAVRYTFTLRELARLAATLPPGDRAPLEPVLRLQVFVAAAAGARGSFVPGDPREDDVPDPYGGNDARYGRVWNNLVEATATILTAFCPVGSTILPSVGARSR
jgi:protein-tyrosine phosphatase